MLLSPSFMVFLLLPVATTDKCGIWPRRGWWPKRRRFLTSIQIHVYINIMYIQVKFHLIKWAIDSFMFLPNQGFSNFSSFLYRLLMKQKLAFMLRRIKCFRHQSIYFSGSSNLVKQRTCQIIGLSQNTICFIYMAKLWKWQNELLDPVQIQQDFVKWTSDRRVKKNKKGFRLIFCGSLIYMYALKYKTAILIIDNIWAKFVYIHGHFTIAPFLTFYPTSLLTLFWVVYYP